MITTLLILLGISLVINIIIFFIAFLLRSDKFTDITYALTFIILVLIALFQNNIDSYKILLITLVILWAVRLGGFLFIRINYFKRDKRFDGRRDKFFSFLSFFLLQGLAVWVILIPTLLFIFIENIVINVFFYIGLIIWIKGFVIESFADYQKFKFIKNKENKTKFISSGFWKYSRHPNYYGEILCWSGIFIMTGSTLYKEGLLTLLIGFISPLFIYLLLRYVSGIPLLEKSSEARYKGNPEYKKYKKETNMLIPWFKK